MPHTIIQFALDILAFEFFFYLKTKEFSFIYDTLLTQPVRYFVDGILLKSLNKLLDKGGQ